MTIQDVLNEVDELKPNQYKAGTKIAWISKLEKKVYNDVITRVGYDGPEPYYDNETDLDTTLIVPDAYGDLYVAYVSSMIDYYNAETERYENSRIMFNSMYDEFLGWYFAKYRQKR